MVGKLLEWNPKWNETTVLGWKLPQLKEVYKKESIKTVEMILASYI